MIVRARPKKLTDVPEEFRCCQAADQARIEEEVFVETDLVTHTDVRCHFCGSLMENVPGVQIVGEPKGNEIMLPLWELDEGETSPPEFLEKG